MRKNLGMSEAYKYLAFEGADPARAHSAEADPFGLLERPLLNEFRFVSMEQLLGSDYFEKESGVLYPDTARLSAEELLNTIIDAPKGVNAAAVLVGTLERWHKIPVLAGFLRHMQRPTMNSHEFCGDKLYYSLCCWADQGFPGSPTNSGAEDIDSQSISLLLTSA